MIHLSDTQLAFLDGRLAEHLTLQPEFATLVSRLLAIGGVRVVPPARPDPDLALLLERGQRWDGEVTLQVGEASQCHLNAARLYVSDMRRFRIATGYALSEDGLWRQHSWLHDDVPGEHLHIVETTELRTCYYGVELTEAEARSLVLLNAW
ncbi:MAG TPA: hypothetical protein VF120_02205 [Ktedonobacterales bacterium]